jgi:transcriptional regulator with XRE-family HTH domain
VAGVDCYDGGVAVAEQEFGEALGRRIKKYREVLGLSQKRVADAVGLPRTSLILVESGRQRVSAYTLLRMSEVLQIDPTTLLTGETAEVEVATGLPDSAPPTVRDFVSRVRRTAARGGHQ